MTLLSRRDFLKKAAYVVGGLTTSPILSACSGKTETTSVTAPTSLPDTPSLNITNTPNQPKITNTPNQLETTKEIGDDNTPTDMPSQVEPTLELPYLAVARNGTPDAMVQRALQALGGIERFVKNGQWVIIKPNICVSNRSYEQAATSNPWVVGALVKLCMDAGASKVQVMDFPFGGKPAAAYVKSGIQEQVEAAGGEMVTMAMIKFQHTQIPEGKYVKQTEIYEDILKADVLINVPIAKTHGLAQLTLGMKNLLGTVLDRPSFHSNIGIRLADLSSKVRPTLTVIDAVRMLMANGPTGGSLNDVKEMNTVIASQDIVAADSYAATLFGMAPNDLSYIKAGVTQGIGRSDLENLKIEELNLSA
jgi:uncharacterized protein (DUF362 family)